MFKVKEKVNQVLVKIMIPCVWAFMKRRRTNERPSIGSFKKAATTLNLVLKPESVMIDFE